MSNAADRPLIAPTPLLSSLSIRDIVLVESLDLDFGAGLTVLTGETGAGKSIILDALGLATGQRADAGQVRSGARAAVATAIFCPPPGHGVWACLTERGLSADPSEDLVLRRQVGADGRSKAYVNDQSVSVGVLRDLGTLLLEVHGQHETVGLLDPRTHGALLDSYGQLGGLVETCRRAFADWRAARKAAETLRQQAAASAAEADELSARLDELDRLDAKPGEELALAGERALLGASEAALEDLKEARDSIGGDQLSQRLAKAFRALDHARTRARQAGAEEGHPVLSRLNHAAEALDRTLVEAEEALSAIDGAADALDVEPGKLDRVEERLFALRALARKLNVLTDDLPKERGRIAGLLRLIEDSDAALKAADQAVAEARRACVAAAAALTEARAEAGARLAAAVMAELGPLKLDKARFRVAFEALPEDRWTGEGAERIAFEVM
ncbi:MAG: AAA family ATPase, partial [Asticcacaulis sp.]